MRLALAALLLLASSLTASAQECFDYGTLQDPDLGTYPCGGTVVALDAAGSHLCEAVRLADGDRLDWTSVADGPEPVLQGSYLLPGRAVRSLHVAGTRAAIALTDGGWMVIDFQFPGSPMLVGQLAGVGCREIDVHGDWVYSAEGLAGLGVYELGAGAPVEQLRIDPDTVYEVDVDGDLCCFVGHRPWVEGDNDTDMYGYTMLVALDLADPGVPAEIGRHEYGNGYGYSTAIGAVRCSGTNVLITRTDQLMISEGGGGGPIYRYSQYANCFDAAPATGMTDTGDFAIVVSSDLNPAVAPCVVVGTRGYVLHGGNLDYLQRDGAAWTAQGQTPLDAVRLAANADYVWGGRNAEVQAMAPQLAGGSPVLGTAFNFGDTSLGLRAVDGYLFLSTMYDNTSWPGGTIDGRIHVLDATDPLNLVDDHSAAEGVWMVFENYAVLGDEFYSSFGTWNWRTGAYLGAPAESYAVIGGAGHVIWVQHTGFLRAYDVSVPAAPVLVGDVMAGDTMAMVSVDGDRAVFAAGSQVIAADVSDPAAPVEIGRVTVGATVRELVLDGDAVYVNNGWALDVLLFDRSSGDLARTGLVNLGNSFRMAYAAPVVYAAVDAGGVAAVDVSSPASPTVIGTATSGVGTTINGAAILGDVLYVDDGDLEALQLHCGTAVPVAIGDLDLAWSDGACRLSWTMDARLGGVRVLASADGRSWVVPWETKNGRAIAVDAAAPVGTTVTYAVQTYGDTGWTTVAQRSVQVPASRLALSDPVPNPFNPETALKYSLERGGDVELAVFDVAGRRVCTLVAEPQTAGPHAATWRGVDDRGRTVPAGVYFARLRTGTGVRTTKLMLLK